MEKYTRLFNKIGLESPIKPPEPLLGGQLHRCLLLVTSHESYVVKELNPKVTKQSLFPNNYELSETMAQSFKGSGINAVAALQFDGHFVQKSDDSYFLIYQYHKGKVLRAANITPQHSWLMGEMFAQIHNKGSTLLPMMIPDWHVHNQSQWSSIFQQAASWIDLSLQRVIMMWIEGYQQSLSVLNQNGLVSHRDLHYGNVIWESECVAHVLDWESVGIIDPWMEVIGYGLEWAGIMRGKFRSEVFDALIRSYSQQCGSSCSYPHEAFYGWLGHCLLPWLYFNLERALGLMMHEQDAEKRGQEALNGGLLRCLYFLEKNQDDLLNRLNLHNF